MKTVNKYILASCVFCYFAGIYLIADKLGYLQLIGDYGLQQVISEWPAEFPSMTMVFIFLAVYTLFFILITYVIYRANENHAKATDQLQQQREVLHNYADRLSLTISQYKKFCRGKNMVNRTQEQRLDLLQKQLAALSPAVYKDNANISTISRIVSEMDETIVSMKSTVEGDMAGFNTQFQNLVEDSIDEIQRIRTNSITLK